MRNRTSNTDQDQEYAMTIHHILRSALFGSTALLAGASGVLAAEVNI